MALKLPEDPNIPNEENLPENAAEEIGDVVKDPLPSPPVVLPPIKFSPTELNAIATSGVGSSPDEEIQGYQESLGDQMRAIIDGQTVPLKMSIAALAVTVMALAEIVSKIPRTPPVPKLPKLPKFPGFPRSYNPLNPMVMEDAKSMTPVGEWYEQVDDKLEQLDYSVTITIQLLGDLEVLNDREDEEWEAEWKRVEDIFKSFGYITSVTPNTHLRGEGSITYSSPLIADSVVTFKNIKDFTLEVPGNKCPLGDVRNISLDIRNTFPEGLRSDLIPFGLIRITKWWITNETGDKKGPYTSEIEATDVANDLNTYKKTELPGVYSNYEEDEDHPNWTVSSTSPESLPYLRSNCQLIKDINEKLITTYIKIPFTEITVPIAIRRLLRVTEPELITE